MAARSLAFTGPSEVEVRDVSIPTPGPDEVLVETRYSGISAGTELLVYRGQTSDDMAADGTIPALDGTLDYPLRYGYAAVGRAIAAGTDVPDEWLGRTVFAFHPHASHFLASPAELHPVPDGCEPHAAALVPNVEAAVNFLMDAGPVVGERAVVFGQGVLGLLTTALLDCHPLEAIHTVDLHPARRERSTDLGADAAYHPDSLDDLASALSDGEVDGADLVVELSGSPDALDDAIAVTGYDGRVVIGSWYGTKRCRLDLGGRFHRSRIKLESSQVSTIDPRLRGRWTKERRLAVAWDRLAEIDADALVTHRIPIERAADAYRLLDRRPNEAIQVLLTY